MTVKRAARRLLATLVGAVTVAVLTAVTVAPAASADTRHLDPPSPSERSKGSYTTSETIQLDLETPRAKVDKRGIPETATVTVRVRKIEEASDGTAVVAPGCWRTTGTVTSDNAFGNTLWTYSNRVDWCVEGNRIHAISPIQVIVDITTLGGATGWRYDGLQSEAQWDYYGNAWLVRNYTQGSFSWCPPRVACVDTVLPWIQIDVYGDGSTNWTWGAG